MSTATIPTESSLARLQQQFTDAVPTMRRAISYHCRRLPRRYRDEFETDVLAATWHACHGMQRRGMDPLAVGLTGVVANAIRYVMNGRQLGVGHSGRGMDVFTAARKHGLKRLSIHDNAKCQEWRELTLSDGRVDPSDAAAFNLDLDAWLATLSPRKLEVARLLALGHETGSAARVLKVTAPAISISRVWLERSWAHFQGETVAESESSVRRPRGRPRKARRDTLTQSPRHSASLTC